VEFNREDIAYIVRNMRDRDRREIFALRWDDDEDALIDQLHASAGAMWRLWFYQGEPVAMNGVLPLRKGVVCANAFGTDKWRHIVRPMIHWSVNWVIPCLKVAGWHRGEAYALAANADGRKFIELLGGKLEAYLYHYGREREDFVLYHWRLDE
jgi:hypothetical protein